MDTLITLIFVLLPPFILFAILCYFRSFARWDNVIARYEKSNLHQALKVEKGQIQIGSYSYANRVPKWFLSLERKIGKKLGSPFFRER